MNHVILLCVDLGVGERERGILQTVVKLLMFISVKDIF